MERTTGAARTNSNGVTTFHDAAGARRPRRRHQPRQRRQHAQRAVEPAGLSPKLAAVARMKKYAFITFGVIFLVVGIVALAIPVLPTTPFLILAAYCFSKGSDYLHDWLLNHKWFGPPIKDWRRNGAIKVQYKIVATLAMAGTGVMIYFETHIPPAGKVAYAVFVAALLGFIWSRPGGQPAK